MPESGLEPRFFGELTYAGLYRESEISTLLGYLKGKPDIPGWRELDDFRDCFEKDGRIFVWWAVMDAAVLYNLDPETFNTMLNTRGLPLESIPPLDPIIDTLKTNLNL